MYRALGLGGAADLACPGLTSADPDVSPERGITPSPLSIARLAVMRSPLVFPPSPLADT